VRTVALLSLIVLGFGGWASGQSTLSAPTDLLQFTEGDRTHEVSLLVTIDDLNFDEYWSRTIDAIFDFADANSDGVLNDDEIKLAPSARAVRLSLGSGFTPPVASIRNLSDVVSGPAQSCSKADLQDYYRRQNAACLTISHGQLPNTAAITARILQALDGNRDGKLSQAEFERAETTLRRLDGNDDELIGVGELVANGIYPGNSASNALRANAAIDLSSGSGGSLQLKRIPRIAEATGLSAQSPGVERAVWQLKVSDQLDELPLKLPTKARCESWTVRAPLSELFDEFSTSVLKPAAEAPAENSAATGRRRGRSNREWLIPMADRDRNGEASDQEVKQWLEVQRQLIRGQVLVSFYYGGGLFEILDTNHDAGLSIRELRNAWATLEAASCTSGNVVELSQIPNVLLLVASQGYPSHLAKTFAASRPEWFRQMDRNSDGDVSRREFTGSPDAFSRLDRDRDGLISIAEAAAGN
jgi:hypothetical protein